jgi:PAS domain S-box-containing protein
MVTEKVKILIVDDLPEKLLVYETILEELGEELVMARSGPEALRHVLKHDFAVILLDVNMPDMDGFETAALIRGRKRCAHTPIIFVTAYADELLTGKGYSQGAVDYILSPVVPEILRTKIKVFVQLFRLNQQVRQQAAQQVAIAQRERARLAAVLENATDFVCSIDPHGRLLYVNRAGCGLLGRSESDPPTEAITAYHTPESRQTILTDSLPVAARDGVWFGEGMMVSNQGRQVPVSQVVLAHKNDSGEAESFSIIAQDISDRKRNEAELLRHRAHLEELVCERTAELQESHERLRLADRLASIGTLAAGLGHDMGNLLLPVRIRLEALEKLNIPASAKEHIEAIKTASEYLRRLSQGLRLFALDPEEGGAVDNHTVLSRWWLDVEPFLRNALPRGVKLQCNLPDDLPALAIPSHRFTQVVYNLVQNAGDALRDRATGTVLVSAQSSDTPGRIIFSVADDGPGMTDEVKQRCMEPFFTTKTRRISTGFGLALVRGAVLKARGSIEIDTTLGKGTTFRLNLPAVVRDPAMVGAASSQRSNIAYVALRDARLGAYVTSVLRSLDVDVRTGSWLEHNNAELIVLEASNGQLTQLEQFLMLDADRRAVVIGGAPIKNHHQQIAQLDARPSPARLREVLLQIVCGRRSVVAQEVT